MCSRDPAEVEAVKNEFLKAGINVETRNNPVAESLGMNFVEMWVMDERDFFAASQLYAQIQDRASGSCAVTTTPTQAKVPDLRICMNELETVNAEQPAQDINATLPKPASGRQRQELEQASSLLEKEIDEMLERDNELAAECSSLRSKMKDLEHALAEGRAALARETESQAAAERAQAEKLSALQKALECERAQRAHSEEQLRRERHESQQQLKSRDDSLKETQKELESKARLIHTQQAAMLELKGAIAALELKREEDQKALAGAHEEAAMEREARFAAEQRAEAAVEAHQSLETQLLQQKELEQRMQAHMASVNSLYSKLHAKRATRV